MDVNYHQRGIDFVWDRQKSAINWRKHDVSFEAACDVFFDPFVHWTTEEMVGEELREAIIGLTSDWRLLYVVYTIRGQQIRLISARVVTRDERRAYENQ